MDFVQECFTYLTQHPQVALILLVVVFLFLAPGSGTPQRTTRSESDYTSQISNTGYTAKQQMNNASADYLRKVRDTTRR